MWRKLKKMDPSPFARAPVAVGSCYQHMTARLLPDTDRSSEDELSLCCTCKFLEVKPLLSGASSAEDRHGQIIIIELVLFMTNC